MVMNTTSAAPSIAVLYQARGRVIEAVWPHSILIRFLPYMDLAHHLYWSY